MSKLMITRNGYDSLMSEIDGLNESLKIVNLDVADGMESRDFREDSAFSVAIEERTKIQKKIQELEELANNCIIAQVDKSTNVVDFGKSVKLLNIDTDETKTFTVVGAYETDPKIGKISYLSPVGKSMMGAKVGDELEVITPTKEVYWEVLDIFIN